MLKFNQDLTTIENEIQKESIEALYKVMCKEKDSGVSGFFNLPYEDKAIIDSKKYIKENLEIISDIQHLIIIGIGGSSLGVKAIDSMLSHLPYRKNINLKFLEHTDRKSVV